MQQYRMSEVPLKHLQRHFHKYILQMYITLQSSLKPTSPTVDDNMVTTGFMLYLRIFILHHLFEVRKNKITKNITKIMKVSKSEVILLIIMHNICQVKEQCKPAVREHCLFIANPSLFCVLLCQPNNPRTCTQFCYFYSTEVI